MKSEMMFAVLFFGFLARVSTQTTSGGIWVSTSKSLSQQYNVNVTKEINSFPIDNIQYLINVEELNFVYYSLYNSTSNKNEIFRARPDGSNPQYVTTTNSLYDDPYGRQGVVKFGIDTANGFLYYAYGNLVYQSLLTGVSATSIYNCGTEIPLSVTNDPSKNDIGFIYTYSSSEYKIRIIEFDGTKWNNISSNAISIPGDFSIYNRNFAYSLNTEIYMPSFSSSFPVTSCSNLSPLEYDWSNGVLYYTYNYTNGESIQALNVTGSNSYNYLISSPLLFNSTIVYLSVDESACPSDCNCRGDCIIESGSNQATCSCYPGYYSNDCSVFCSSTTCNNGECNSEGTCSCQKDYYGPNCNQFCSSETNCTNNGYCISTNTGGECVCNEGYLGSNCTVKEPPTIAFSGGIIAQPYGDFIDNSSIFNWNFNATSKTFPFPNANYILLDPNSDYVYFSLYNIDYQCNQLFRSYSDGSEMKLIYNLTSLSGTYIKVQKFSFDANFQNIYFPSSGLILRYSLQYETIEQFYNAYEFLIYSVVVDSVTNNVWLLSFYEFGCITQSKQQCSTNRSTFEYISDFVVYNSTTSFIEISVNEGYSINFAFVDAKGGVQRFALNQSPNMPSCDCLTIDPSLTLIYFSSDSQILTATITKNFEGVEFGPAYSLPYSETSLGVSFLSYTPSQCTKDCEANGDCIIYYDGPAECECYANYYSSDCSNYCSNATCSNNGVCDNEGSCICDEGYYSNTCDCNSEINCSGNGKCTSSGTCTCFEYYSGISCNTPIVSSPILPSSFSCTAFFMDQNISQKLEIFISVPYQDRRFDFYNANNVIDQSIFQNFVYGLQYNVTYNPNECSKEDLSAITFSSFEVPSTAKLTYFNGTAGSCLDNAVEVWNTPSIQYTYVQLCESTGSYSVPYQIYWIDQSKYLNFIVDSYQFNIPSSNFTLPTFC